VKTSLPSPQQQLSFLQQLQRILSEGGFVATYKYALLHALADLCVLKGEDTGAELRLKTREISEQIIELYWRQAGPFPAPNSREPVVLQQNTGSQAAILNHLISTRREFGDSLAQVRGRAEAWEKLVAHVDVTVREMPLWRLQTVGGEQLSFLYENHNDRRVREITLRPGVAYCFRAFYDLITDLIRSAWLRFVRSNNALVLGETGNLSTFLFGSERSGLAVYRPILMEVQRGACFYCGKDLGTRMDVDHFIPWARYRRSAFVHLPGRG
jgi:hypothetical protein